MPSAKKLCAQFCRGNINTHTGKCLASGKEVSIVSEDGTRLYGDIYSAPEEKRILLVVHGYGSSADAEISSEIESLLEQGTSVAAMELRGHGHLADIDCTWGIRERKDVFAWISWLNENKENDVPIYVVGKTLGAAAALMTGCRKLPSSVHGYIAVDTYASPWDTVGFFMQKSGIDPEENLEKLDQQLMSAKGFSLLDYDIEEAYKGLQRPVLFITTGSENYPEELMHSVYDNCPSEKRLVNTSSDGDALEKINEFFAENDAKEFSSEVHLHYPERTMYDAVLASAKRVPNDTAYEFYGSTSYAKFVEKINTAAKAFLAHGYKAGDTITICMPNLPQALDALYACDEVGIVASMIHPLSAEKEIVHYLTLSESKAIICPDMFYEKVLGAVKLVDHPVDIFVVRVQDNLNPLLTIGYDLKVGRKFRKFPFKGEGMLWSDLMKEAEGQPEVEPIPFDKNRTALILYSGGTTGLAKGICLSDLNFNALGMQTRVGSECAFDRGTRFLSAMPVFHGFGLGIGIHTILELNSTCILMANFNTKTYAEAMIKQHPNFVAGVPTIFKMLLNTDLLEGKDLSYLRGMFVGGDSMPVPLKREVDNFLRDHNAGIQVREGYGLTETVTASCLTPKDTYKEGSIGIPFPDMVYSICKPDTQEELPVGETGEIIIHGPTVMLGYLHNEEATAKALQKHADGNIWLHTGDLGHMDEDGYVYFDQRMKRMIITSGYNVSPAQVENAIAETEGVDYCCVIGVKDPFKMQRIKAFVVLKEGYKPSEKMKKTIVDNCRDQIAGYALPREIEFRTELPKTLVGKVAFHVLEEEENAKQEATKD